MRPHTRTQCTNGKDCAACSKGLPTQGFHDADAGSSKNGHQGHYLTGAPGLNSNNQGSSGNSQGHGGPGINGVQNGSPFVAPSSGPLRRSLTGATKGNSKGMADVGNRSIPVVELPAEILVKILNYMSFKEISQVRLVSRRFNEICASMLNSTFQRLQSRMLSRFQSIKGQMPRRESARRNHPLSRECDIVETLHMRLTLLQMTFGKHIERKHVCFFAGEILDEVQRILRYIRQTPSLANIKAYKVTDELFDLSTMAMEYFKEHIEPTLPEITYFGAEFLDFATPFATPTKRRSQSGSTTLVGFGLDSPCSSRASVAGSSCSDHWSVSSTAGNSDDPSQGQQITQGDFKDALPQSNMVLRKRIRRIRQGMKRYNDQLVEVKRDLKSCKGKMEAQSKQVLEYSSRLEEYDKKFEESSRKFQTLLTELNKCKTELQYWRSKSTSLLSLPPTCAQCEAPLLPLDTGAKGSGLELGPIENEGSVNELKALANQGVYPLLDGDKPNLTAEDKEVQIKASPSSPKPITASRSGGPPSPSMGGRKRRSRDEAIDEHEPTRKSLRGAGVKGTRGKRPKLAATNQ